MFERNRIETAVQHQIPVAVEIIRDDGTVLKGRFIVSAARAFSEVLNGQGQFLEFEPHGWAALLSGKIILEIRDDRERT